MKETLRANILAPYSLHDMTVTSLEADKNELILRPQSGMIKVSAPCRQVDGHVVFHQVAWDFSYAYLLDYSGNAASFHGEKMPLRDFITSFTPLGFTIMDETYGYNTTKYTGYLAHDKQHLECMLEIYHEGDMLFLASE